MQIKQCIFTHLQHIHKNIENEFHLLKMSENHFLSYVSKKLKHEYQEGTVNEIQLNCAKETTLQVEYYYVQYYVARTWVING